MNQGEQSTSEISVIDSFTPPDNSSFDLFIAAVRNNNISLLKSLKSSHIINTFFDGPHNALHIAIIQGHERMLLWMLAEGADLNVKTLDHFDTLTLAVFYQHSNLTQMILSRVDPNYSSPKGTPLFIAASLDNPEILTTLLSHPKINLNKGLNDMTPMQVAGPKCLKLLQKEEALLIETFRNSITNYIRMTQISQNSLIVNLPQLPPIVKGKIIKVNYFKIFSYDRYIVVDPLSGVLARYKQMEDFPLNPCQLIPLELIRDISLSAGCWFQRSKYFYLKMIYGDSQIYFGVSHLEVARKWKEIIQKAIGYYKYQQSKIEEYSQQERYDKIQQALIHQMQNLVGGEITLLDQTQLDQVSYLQQKQEEVHQQYKGKMEIVQEQSKYEDDVCKYLELKDLEIFECIGKGSFGYVYKVKYQDQVFALKQQEKAQLINTHNLKYSLSEISILKKTYHPYLVNCIQSFQTPLNLYLLLEYCPNGDLSEYMTRGIIWGQQQAKFYVAQIVLAIEYLHSLDILYRDLKPENVALDAQYNIKLLDFGLSKEDCSQDFVAQSICGSPAYMSPEILNQQGATRATDVYEIGLILYEMLTGYPPFFNLDINKMFHDISENFIKIPPKLSFEAKDLLSKVLLKDPKKRLNLAELKKHAFFYDIDWHKLLRKQYKGYTLVKQFPTKIAQKHQLVDYDYPDDQTDNFILNWNFNR